MSIQTATELRDRGVYRLGGTMYVARRNDDLPNGDFLFALYEYVKGGVEDVPHLFVDLDGESISTSLAHHVHDGMKARDLSDTGLNAIL